MKATALNVATGAAAQELQEIFEQQYRFVYRTAYSVTGSAEDAEDVLQTLFMRLLGRPLPPGLKDNPEPYLYRAAFNLSLNIIQSRKRHVLTDDVEAFDTRNASTGSVDDEEIDKRLHDAIAKLTPAAAQIVILRYVHNYSLAEIATLLGTTRSTVAVSLFRSRARLKKLVSAPLGAKR